MANRFANEFKGALRISYSGGADFFNIKQLFEAGIWPITMATTILKARRIRPHGAAGRAA